MAYKQKSVLKFGQKSAFKAKKYSPGKQVSGPDPSGEGPAPQPGVERKPKEMKASPSPGKQKQQKADPPMEKMEGSKEKYDAMLKEWLITNRGFNQADADRMIKDGAYDWKDMMKDVPAEPKSPLEQGHIFEGWDELNKNIPHGTIGDFEYSPKARKVVEARRKRELQAEAKESQRKKKKNKNK
tara:strand:- start:272 stop:823 length:552 start_codon:yes stop_codon:yes gene_type:complete